MRLLGVRVRELSKHSEFVVSALQVNEERVETLADGVDKIDDAVLEVSRCVREAFSEKVVVGQANRETTLNNIGQSRRRRGRRLNHERDQGYETVDEDVLKEEVGVKSTYTELQYTTPDYKEDDDDWENRTVLTEVELIGSTKNKSKSIADKLDKERREDQV